jgi:hypothetical protein
MGHAEGPLFLIALTDEATGRTLARLTRENSVEENLETLRQYVLAFGRPMRVRTDRSTLFGQQISRALKELDIEWLQAESPQEPGLSTVFLETAWENLPGEFISARVRTLEGAVQYLDSVYLSRWNGPISAPAPGDAHRPLLAEHDLGAICCVVLPRTFLAARSILLDRTRYLISGVPNSVVSGEIRVEKRAGGELTARWNGKLVTLTRAGEQSPSPASPNKRHVSIPRKPGAPNRAWMNGFFSRDTPPIWKLYR